MEALLWVHVLCVHVLLWKSQQGFHYFCYCIYMGLEYSDLYLCVFIVRVFHPCFIFHYSKGGWVQMWYLLIVFILLLHTDKVLAQFWRNIDLWPHYSERKWAEHTWTWHRVSCNCYKSWSKWPLWLTNYWPFLVGSQKWYWKTSNKSTGMIEVQM